MLLFAGPIFVTVLVKGARWTYAYLSGDSMYYLAVARNVARYGQFTYDGEYPTNGFHPLWQLCVVLVYRLAAFLAIPDPLIPTVVLASSVVVISIAIWVLGRCFVRAHGSVPIVFVFLPVGVYGLLKAFIEPQYGPLWSYADGMESCLVILSYALLLYLMVGSAFLESARSALLTGIVVAALCLSRLDHALFAVPFFGCLILRSVARRCGRDFLLTALAMAPVLVAMTGYLAINMGYAGTPLPVSGIVKTSFPFPIENQHMFLDACKRPTDFYSLGIFWRVAQIFVPMFFAVLCLARGMILLVRRRSTRFDFALYATALFVVMLGAYNWLYVHLIDQGQWYFPISVLFVSVFAFHVLARFAPSRLLERKAGWCLLLILVVSVSAFSAVYRKHGLNVSYHTFLTQEAPPLNEHYKGRRIKLIEYDDGLLCYGADFQVMSGTLLAADKEAVSYAIKERKSLLTLAYDRGFDRIASWGYGGLASRLEYGMSSREIEHLIGPGSYLGGFMYELPRPLPLLFSVDYVSPSHNFVVVRMREVDECYLKARERRRAGDWQGVVESLERAVKSDEVPRERVFLELGEAYSHMHEAAKAASAFQRALAVNRALVANDQSPMATHGGFLVEVYANIGTAHLELGNVADGIEACQKALDLSTTFLEKHLTGQCGEGRYLGEVQGTIARAHWLLGHRAEAVVAYRRATELFPTNGELTDELAGVLAEVGGLQGALEGRRTTFGTTAGVAQQNAESLARGAGASRVSDWDEVVEACRALVEAEPNSAQPRLHLADALERTGDLADALEAYHAAIAIDADSLRYAVEGLSDAAYDLARRDKVEQALQRYRAAIAFAPDGWYAYDSLDKAFIERKDAETRIAEWRRAVQQYPQAVRPLFHLGMALQHGGHTDEAIETFKKALARDPHNDGIRGQLGCVLAWEGDFDGVLRVCREPAAIEPAFAGMVADALEDGANTLMAQDRAKEASEGYRGAIELAPASAAKRYPLLIEALCQAGDYDAARKEAAICRETGVELPPEVLQGLEDESEEANN